MLPRNGQFSKVLETIKNRLFERTKTNAEKLRQKPYAIYDKFTGMDRVMTAHHSVVQEEKAFLTKQLETKEIQKEVFAIQENRNRLNQQLDLVRRDNPEFLKLVTELHELAVSAKEAQQRLSNSEADTQVALDKFSTSLRYSHAEERAQASRMRQWTIVLSVLSGTLGFSITWLRYREAKHYTNFNHNPIAASVDEFTSLKESISELQQQLNEGFTSFKESISELQRQLNGQLVVCSSVQPQRVDAKKGPVFGEIWMPSGNLKLCGAVVATVLLIYMFR